MNLFRRRTIPLKSLIHQAVYERGEAYKRLLRADATPVT
ncbi:MAG: hypothetical protein QOD11_2198 [Bradyrhizobium sp.]|jgi:hypothetical protein|nr:hypothetical protein [Bradyrhizobium sp.]